MKRFLMSLLTIAACCGMVTAQEISVADVEVVPGKTASFTLTVNVGEGVHSGFQFEMHFPATGFATTGKTWVSELWAGGTLAVGDLVEGMARGSAYSGSDTQIPAGRLDVATIEFTAEASLALGDYEVSITHFDFLDGTNYVRANDVTFTIHVVDALTVVLDENSTEAPASTDDEVNVTVRRTIKAGEWSTICLPFAMSEEQVKEAFGDDVELADFTGCDTDYDDEDNVTAIKVNFSNATEIQPNHPYIIKVKNDVGDFSVPKVVVEPSEELSVDKDEVREGKPGRYVYYYNSFVGTYTSGNVPELCLFLNDNKFWYSRGGSRIKAFRGYFDFMDLLPGVVDEEARISLHIVGDEATAIEGLAKDFTDRGTARNTFFDLQGRRVERPAHRGIYIGEGRKKVVK